MSQWAEVRHLHLVEKVPKKEIARRLQLDVKTVRRAVDQQAAPVRASPPRARGLDPWRAQIEQWLRQDRRLTAKRIRRLLLPLAGPVAARTVRRYVAALKAVTAPKEAFVHRSVLAGTTMEVDFGGIVVRHCGGGVQGQVPGSDVASQQRVFRQGVSARAARVAARRHACATGTWLPSLAPSCGRPHHVRRMRALAARSSARAIRLRDRVMLGRLQAHRSGLSLPHQLCRTFPPYLSCPRNTTPLLNPSFPLNDPHPSDVGTSPPTPVRSPSTAPALLQPDQFPPNPQYFSLTILYAAPMALVGNPFDVHLADARPTWRSLFQDQFCDDHRHIEPQVVVLRLFGNSSIQELFHVFHCLRTLDVDIYASPFWKYPAVVLINVPGRPRSGFIRPA